MRPSACSRRSNAATLEHDNSGAAGAIFPACRKWGSSRWGQMSSRTCTEPAGLRPRPASLMVTASPSPSWGGRGLVRRAVRLEVVDCVVQQRYVIRDDLRSVKGPAVRLRSPHAKEAVRPAVVYQRIKRR